MNLKSAGLTLLALGIAFTLSPAARADQAYILDLDSPTLQLDITFTAAPVAGQSYSRVTSPITGAIWESSLGSPSPITGTFDLIPTTGTDHVLGVGINPAGSASCAVGSQTPPADGACAINGLFYYDNLIYPNNAPGAGSLDWGGILFGAGGLEFNIFSDGNNWFWADSQNGHSNNLVILANVGEGSGLMTATPEPGSLLLLGTGLLGVALLVFQRGKVRRGMQMSL